MPRRERKRERARGIRALSAAGGGSEGEPVRCSRLWRLRTRNKQMVVFGEAGSDTLHVPRKKGRAIARPSIIHFES
eukprot:1583848-Rhodomonas_salina.1